VNDLHSRAGTGLKALLYFSLLVAFTTALCQAQPTISSFAPPSGKPGDSITIYGNGFTGNLTVQFSQFQTANFRVVNSGQLAATVPSGAVTGPISVQNTSGIAYSPSDFVVNIPTDLSVLAVASPKPVTVTSNLVFTILASNNTTNSAPNVVLSNTLPGFPATVFLKSALVSQGTVNTNANPIVANFGTLNANSSATLTLTFAPQAVGTLTNTDTVGSNYSDPNAANNTAVTTVDVVPQPVRLSIQLLSGNSVKISWPLNFSNYVLESKANLSSNAVWLTNSSPVVSNTVVETVSNTARFYRLIK
jgi:hypothetical protein